MKQNATQHTAISNKFWQNEIMDIARLGAANKFANNISTQRGGKTTETFND